MVDLPSVAPEMVFEIMHTPPEVDPLCIRYTVRTFPYKKWLLFMGDVYCHIILVGLVTARPFVPFIHLLIDLPKSFSMQFPGYPLRQGATPTITTSCGLPSQRVCVTLL